MDRSTPQEVARISVQSLSGTTRVKNCFSPERWEPVLTTLCCANYIHSSKKSNVRPVRSQICRFLAETSGGRALLLRK